MKTLTWQQVLTWMRSARTRFHRTRMRHPIFQSVWPTLLSSRHRTVIIKPISSQSTEHSVATNLKEGSSHSLDVFRINSSISYKHFSHSDNLIGPFDFVKTFAIRMSNSMWSNFMTIGIQVLDLAIVGPFVGDIEGRFDWALVGVSSTLGKEIFEELLIETVNSIVKGQQYKLRYVLPKKIRYKLSELFDWWHTQPLMRTWINLPEHLCHRNNNLVIGKCLGRICLLLDH